MQLIPYDRFSITTEKSLPEITEILLNNIEREGKYEYHETHLSKKLFIGQILDNCLFIYRSPYGSGLEHRWRTIIQPHRWRSGSISRIQLRGRLLDYEYGSRIVIEQILDGRYLLIALVYSVIIIHLASSVLTEFINSVPSIIIKTVVIAIDYLLFKSIFWIEATQNRKYFYKLIKGVEIKNPCSNYFSKPFPEQLYRFLDTIMAIIGLGLMFLLLVLSP